MKSLTSAAPLPGAVHVREGTTWRSPSSRSWTVLPARGTRTWLGGQRISAELADG